MTHPRRGVHALKLKLSDEYAITCAFREFMGYEMDWKNPTSFSQKLQWLKVHDRKPIYTKWVDKYESKKIVEERIGEEYVIPTLGVWNHFDEIDFDLLPNQFVLKCTHDSGSIVICNNKQDFKKEEAKIFIEKCLHTDYYATCREWPYKNVPRKIIAEKFMKDDVNPLLTDYKFYCFQGEPKFLYVSYGMSNHDSASLSYVTLDWKPAPFKRPDYLEYDILPPKPKTFDKMLDIAKCLSSDIPFVRVDLYEINGQPYFSEMTFFPGGGMTPFKPQEWDWKLGEYLQIPLRNIIREYIER